MTARARGVPEQRPRPPLAVGTLDSRKVSNVATSLAEKKGQEHVMNATSSISL